LSIAQRPSLGDEVVGHEQERTEKSFHDKNEKPFLNRHRRNAQDSTTRPLPCASCRFVLGVLTALLKEVPPTTNFANQHVNHAENGDDNLRMVCGE
jgi:hypothetical protein